MRTQDISRMKATCIAHVNGATHYYIFSVYYNGYFVEFSYHYVVKVDGEWREVGYYINDMRSYCDTNMRKTGQATEEGFVKDRNLSITAVQEI